MSNLIFFYTLVTSKSQKHLDLITLLTEIM